MLLYVEYIGVITGLLCVYFAAREKILNWPFAIVSILCYTYVFFQSKLYGDSFLQFYFLLMSIYGWVHWSKHGPKERKKIVVFNKLEMLRTLLITFLMFLAIYYILDHYTDTDVPFVDGLCTAISLTAQFLLARKVLQNWYLWIAVDVIYVPLYWYKHLYPTILLYVLFLVLSIMGIRSWRKTLSSPS